MYLKPSQAYAKIFTLTGLDGELIAADTLPTAAAYHNGTLDVGFALTVTSLATGKYAVTGTIPATYAQDDLVEIVVDATIAGQGTAESIHLFQIETRLDLLPTLKKYAENAKALVKAGAVWSLIIYDDDGTTPLITKALTDKDGNNITDPAAGTIAREAAGV